MDERQTLSVERTILDLSRLEDREQFEFFSDEICRRFAHQYSEKVVERDDFPARIDSIDVGASQCTLVDTPVHALTRTKQHVGMDEQQDLVLNFLLTGVIDLSRGDERLRLVPGSISIIDNGKPSSFVSSSSTGFHSALCVRLNRNAYSTQKARAGLQCDKRFVTHRYAGLLKTSLTQLSASMRGLNNIEIATLLGVAEALVALIANDEGAETIDPVSMHAFQLVETEIMRQLGNSSMNAGSVASVLGLPVSSVEQILAGQFTSFEDVVRGQRLSLALSMLCDLDHRNKTVEDIAQSCGFADLASFHDAFKHAFECTPRDVRQASDKPDRMN